MSVPSHLCLTAHPSPIPDLRPPVERLLKHVVPDAGPTNHWFWNDNRRNHRHNARGHALFTWKVPPTRRSRFKTRGEYCVVRVFLEQRAGLIPPRTQIENLCRLPQCVNPDHWRVHQKLPAWRIEVQHNGMWQLVDYRSSVACLDVEVVRVYDGRGVHVVRVAPLSQRLDDNTMRALCGVSVDIHKARLVDALVTCESGC